MKIRPRASTVTAGLIGIVSVISLVISSTFNQTVSATVPGVNELVNQSSSGTVGNSGAIVSNHAISGNGRYVVFYSSATNLTPEATAGIFVRDTTNHTTTMASLSDTGSAVAGWNAKISYDGRYVVFSSSTANVVAGVTGSHVYIRDLVNNTTRIVDTSVTGVPSARGANSPDVNADGRFVVFMTSDPTLLGVQPAYDLNISQVAVKDMVSGKIRSLTSTATQESRAYQQYGSGNEMYPSIDCDGRQVAFATNNDYLYPRYQFQGYSRVDLYVATIDWDGSSVIRATPYGTGTGSTISNADTPPQISCNGNSVVFSSSGSEPGVNITNYVAQTLQYNRLTSQFSVASANSSGTWNNQTDVNVSAVAASDDGRYVAFTAKGTNLDSSKPQTSKYTDYDVFVRDTKTGVTNLVSFTALGNHSGRVLARGNNTMSISPDGSTIAYTYKTSTSDATSELISGVNTGNSDVYISKTGF